MRLLFEWDVDIEVKIVLRIDDEVFEGCLLYLKMMNLMLWNCVIIVDFCGKNGWFVLCGIIVVVLYL